jgi:hypothetical protein
MREGTVVFFVIVFFVILFVLCLLGWQNKNESDKFKAKGCFLTTKTIAVNDKTGWQCPDGCFYYKTYHGEFICFKD